MGTGCGKLRKLPGAAEALAEERVDRENSRTATRLIGPVPAGIVAAKDE